MGVARMGKQEEGFAKAVVAPVGVAPAGVALAGVAPVGVAPAGVAPVDVALAGVAPAGVAPAGVAPVGVAPVGVAPAGVALAGVAPVGVAPDGVAPAGVAPAGVALAGVAPAGVALAGVAPAGVALAGVAPAGVAPVGVALAGVALAGVAPVGVARTCGATAGSARAGMGRLSLVLLCGLTGFLGVATADDSPLSQLRQAVFFGYDKNVMPQKVRNMSSRLEVELGIAPLWFQLDAHGALQAQLWIRMTWSDYRLEWNPSDHHNISVFIIHPEELWKPDIALYNKNDLNNGILAADPRSATTNIRIFSNGFIEWIAPVSHQVRCHGMTYVNWPWGDQSCHFKFGSWTFDAQHYDLQFYNKINKMDMTEYNNHPNQFEVISQEGVRTEKMYSCCPQPWVDLNFSFTMRRLYIVDQETGRIDNPNLHSGQNV